MIEVLGVRLLSPFFGSTMFTVSSVIGVFLGALSAGYYVGGIWADKYPTWQRFWGIIVLSGVSILVMFLVQIWLMPMLGHQLSLRWGPLISSLILLFVPGFWFGTLSPLGLKLQQSRFPEVGIGRIAGEMSFWSTMGSITGSLLTGLVLIPLFGISSIVLVTGIFLGLLGLVPLWILKKNNKFTFGLMGLLMVMILLSGWLFMAQGSLAIFEKDGFYSRITIWDEKKDDGRTIRHLFQDRTTSGAIYLDNGEFAYDFFHFFSINKAFQPQTEKVLVIGGGAYLIPKTVLADPHVTLIDVVEVEPDLFALSQEYFGLPGDPRLHNYIVDGRRFLHDTTTTYDYIFSDAYYSLYSIPTHLTTKEFLSLAKTKLKPNGVLAGNIIGNVSPEPRSLTLSMLKTWIEVFPNSYVFAVNPEDLQATQNFIFVGWNSETKLPPELFGTMTIRDKGLEYYLVDIDQLRLDDQIVLTDDYAPVDYLTGLMLEKAELKEE